MGRLSATLIKACNLRTAAVLFALWLLLGLSPPAWFSDLAGYVDRSIFRVGLYASELPVPHTLITVVHVPEIEYERWLADLPGASGLQKLFTAIDNDLVQPKPLVGVVLEQPLGLIQPEAESVLAEIQRGRRRTDHFYQEARELLDRREYLVERLRSERVILGLLDQVPTRFHPLEAGLGQLARLPPWLRPWLQQAPPAVSANTGGPLLSYLPIPLNGGAKQYMALQTEDKYLPTFWAQFLAAAEAQQLESPESGLPLAKAMFWHQDRALAFRQSSVPVGSDAGFVPVYGAMSSIRSSLRQISLEAALAADKFGDWVLIGRDGDVRLDQVAQILASVGDQAMLAEPWWWPAIQKILLLLNALLLCALVPILPWRAALILVAVLIGIAVAAQVAGQSLASLWLPSGALVGFSLLAFALLWLWRWQASVAADIVARADQASLALARSLTARGELDRAYGLTTSCRSSPPVLEQIYQIGLRYEAHGHFAKAWRALREIKRRKRRYKDVPVKLKRIRSLALSQSVQALESAPKAAIEGASEQTGGKSPVPLQQTQKLPQPESQKRAVFGRYQVIKELGRGASGTVFLGYDPLIAREVAIKTLNYHQFSAAELVDVKARFLREAEAAGRLSHPNIVPVFDVGEQDGCAYIAMDFAKGRTLSAFTAPDNILPAFEVYRIALNVAEALAYAHDKKIVHRDIKPGNVLYCPEPYQVKVTDFGIARFMDHAHTQTGEILGSPLYMAPEQVLGKKVETSADIFSLGTLFYQLLCGRLPFNGDSLAALTYEIVHSKHKSVRVENKALPASAARITNVALQKKPNERYQSAEAMAEALRKAIRRDFPQEAKVAGLVI